MCFMTERWWSAMETEEGFFSLVEMGKGLEEFEIYGIWAYL